jgi:hypothetical protein
MLKADITGDSEVFFAGLSLMLLMEQTATNEGSRTTIPGVIRAHA